jgi:tetratricopeptide (TPR) repeat protein
MTDAPTILKIGPYRTSGIVGVGGYGTVYRATGPSGEAVALKVVAGRFASSDILERFRREGALRIDHPNVVRTLDAGVGARGEHYIALEMLEGVSLAERSKAGAMPAPEVISIAIQVCRGLAAAHDLGVVHRDLKPGNIFLCRDGTVKLLDFGIARSLETDTHAQLTVEGSVIGTPGYLSPEQARGDRNVDERSDVWSLGVILYRMLSGIDPFIRDTQVATILAVVLEEPERLDRVQSGLPRGLSEAVARCLSKNRYERWASVRDLEAALETIDPGSRRSSDAAELTLPGAPALGDEQRVVALLLASGVSNLAGLRASVEDQGGELIPMLGGRAIAVFGGRAWEGDEVTRAVSAAVQARATSEWMAVSSGRATGRGGAVSGEAVRAVERALDAKLQGIAVAALPRTLGGFELSDPRDGIVEVIVDPTGTHPRLLSLEPPPDTAIVGRATELAQLDAIASAAFDDERVAVAVVVGPPGIGKSRLRHEMVKRLASRTPPVRTVVAGCESHRRGSAFHLLANAVRALLSPRLSVPALERRTELLDLCRGFLGASALDCAETVAALLGLSDETAPTVSRISDPQLLVDKTRLALADLLVAIAKEPLALFFDDLQWADEGSLAVIEDIVARASDRPLFLFVAGRGELLENHPDLFRDQGPTRITPRGLLVKHVAQIADSIAGHPLRPELIEAVTARTGGNPMFVEQILRAVVERNLASSPVEALPTPIDVEAAVQSRLDHLPPEEKSLCKRAAVFGDEIEAAVLAVLDVEEAEETLDRLVRRGLFTREGTRYRFQTGLVAEVAYRMNGEQALAELHRACGQFLETQPESDPETVGRHFELGGARELAARSYTKAALRAARRGDGATVLRCSDKALDLGPAESALFDLHIARAEALSFLGRREEQERELDRAVPIAASAAERVRVLIERLVLHAATGSLDRALVDGPKAIEAARETADPDAIALALVRYTWVLLYSGKVPDAVRAVAEATEIVREDEANERPRIRPSTAGLVAAWRAQAAAACGDLGGRKQAYDEAIRLYHEAGDLRRAAQAESNLADTLNRVGAYDDATGALEASIALSRRVGNRPAEGFALANLGYALTRLSRTQEALAAFARAETIANETAQLRLRIAVRVYRARALLDALAADEVVREAEAAADEARRGDMPALGAIALSLAARAWLRAGDPAMALALSERAMALHQKLGSIEEDEIDLFLTHARVELANSSFAQARATVARGMERLTELAERIVDPEWRRRFREDVREHRELEELARAR